MVRYSDCPVASHLQRKEKRIRVGARRNRSRDGTRERESERAGIVLERGAVSALEGERQAAMAASLFSGA